MTNANQGVRYVKGVYMVCRMRTGDRQQLCSRFREARLCVERSAGPGTQASWGGVGSYRGCKTL
eukprot:223922-Pyramimonas_sp.AAC.1